MKQKNVLPSVLYTDAKEDKFRLCNPGCYAETEDKTISDDLTRTLTAICTELDQAPDDLWDEFSNSNNNKKTPLRDTSGSSKATMYAVGLGVPTTLLTLICLTGYYLYGRNFKSTVKTPAKATPDIGAQDNRHRITNT